MIEWKVKSEKNIVVDESKWSDIYLKRDKKNYYRKESQKIVRDFIIKTKESRIDHHIFGYDDGKYLNTQQTSTPCMLEY